MKLRIRPRYQEIAKTATLPVPEFWALCCPACEKHKMRPYSLLDIKGYICQGPECGHFMPETTAQSFIGLQMVAE